MHTYIFIKPYFIFFNVNLCECHYLKTSSGGNSPTCCFSLPHDSSINKDKVFPQLRGYYILNTWNRNIASNALVGTILLTWSPCCLATVLGILKTIQSSCTNSLFCLVTQGRGFHYSRKGPMRFMQKLWLFLETAP